MNTTPMTLTRDDCLALDAADPLRALREQFSLPPGVVYLDGNSLGAQPASTPARVAEVVQQEWGTGLIRSWNSAGWITLPQRVGDKIGQLIGAQPGETLVADSTSINLYKVLSTAIRIAQADAPSRRVILSERSNFPTDLYIAQSLAQQHGLTLELTTADQIEARLGPDVAVLMLTQVNYRSGRLLDMAAITAAAHRTGALTVWDLAHSAGAVPVDLNGADADFAIGCGYKYLNGGPGAPAFVWAHARHADRFWQPLSGWMGHAAPFRFDTEYRPAPGMARYLCGTPPLISMSALECGVDTVLAAGTLGGMAALRAKSLQLSELFIAQVAARCSAHDLPLASPDVAAERGSQVSLACKVGGLAVMQALIARQVIGDFRAGDGSEAEPDLLRFGFTPLYTRFVDVFDAVTALCEVLDTAEWREARFNQQAAVT
ncbi:kynureninase [Ideonella sp.]|uniref:kynureninase n=1 Tax=Ideonella sp. TaxID=1929293 RepID=UPI003BB4B826